MMATGKKESLDVEPAVKATSANRQLFMKNSRATDNWFRARKALDREKRHYESKMNMDRTALLKQRERLQSATLTLNTVHEAEFDKVSTPVAVFKPPQESTVYQRRMTLADVYDSLIKSAREQKHQSNNDNRSIHSEPTGLSKVTGSTASFDNKKVGRKPLKFTLQSLQRAQSNLQEKLQAIAQEQEEVDNDANSLNAAGTPEPSSPPGLFDLSEEEESLGPKLRLPPTSLPPIRSQAVFKPRTRSYEQAAVKSKSVENLDDIRYCRYIRGGRRNSAPIVSRPRVTLKRATRQTNFGKMD